MARPGGLARQGGIGKKPFCHGLHSSIKVRTDLVRGVARFAIDIQVLTDLKKRVQVNDTGPNHQAVLPFCSLRSPDLKHKARPGGLALQGGGRQDRAVLPYREARAGALARQNIKNTLAF